MSEKSLPRLHSSHWWLPFCLFLFLWTPPDRAFSAMISLEGNGGWIGADGPKMGPSLSGKVVLFDFWDYTCINCIRTFPHLNRLYKKYAPKGLVIVAIHSPEFSFAGTPERIEHAIQQYHLVFPVVMDKDMVLWNRFHNHYWPADYLYDRSGHLVYHAIGEGDYDQLESKVRSALHLKNTGSLDNTQPDFHADLTPELYAGYSRGQLGNPSGYHHKRTFLYSGHPSSPSLITLHGEWRTTENHIASLSSDKKTFPSLTVLYHGQGVNAVLKRSSERSEIPIVVLLDKKPVPKKFFGRDLIRLSSGSTGVRVRSARMYSLLSGQAYGPHRIDLLFPKSGTEVYTLTFNP